MFDVDYYAGMAASALDRFVKKSELAVPGWVGSSATRAWAMRTVHLFRPFDLVIGRDAETDELVLLHLLPLGWAYFLRRTPLDRVKDIEIVRDKGMWSCGLHIEVTGEEPVEATFLLEQVPLARAFREAILSVG